MPEPENPLFFRREQQISTVIDPICRTTAALKRRNFLVVVRDRQVAFRYGLLTNIDTC